MEMVRPNIYHVFVHDRQYSTGHLNHYDEQQNKGVLK